MDLMNPANPMNMVNPASPWYHVWNAHTDDTPVSTAVNAAAESGDDTAFVIFLLVALVVGIGAFAWAVFSDL